MKNRLIPPSYFNAFLLLAIALHYVLPVKQLILPPYTYLGLLIILIGVGLNVWAVGTLKRRKTTIDFHDTPLRLVTDGPFGVSRNPVYLSGVTSSFGVAVLLGSLTTFVFPVVLMWILSRFYIPAEENALEDVFGSEYLAYKRRVRRWI